MQPSVLVIPDGASVITRFGVIAQTVAIWVAARVRPVDNGCRGSLIPLAIENIVNAWVLARRRAILALLERIEAGAQRSPRPYRARAAKEAAAESALKPAGAKPRARLPAMRGWLASLGVELCRLGEAMARWLEDPQARAMAEAHPQLGRLLRPLLRALNQSPPAWLPQPHCPPRKRRPRPPRTPDPEADAPPDEWRPVRQFVASEVIRRDAAWRRETNPPPSALPPQPDFLPPLGMPRYADPGPPPEPAAWRSARLRGMIGRF